MSNVINNGLKNQKGYIALIAILIIVAVTLAVGISMSLLGVGQTQASLTEQQSRQSFQLADSCFEEAVLRIKRAIEKNETYTGGNLNLSEGSCNITVEANKTSCIVPSTPPKNPPQNYRTVYIEANVNNIIRNLVAEIYLTGNNLTLDCWKEIESNYAI